MIQNFERALTMKHLIILITIVALSSVISAQSKIIISDGSALIVPIGAEICADEININAGGCLDVDDQS